MKVQFKEGGDKKLYAIQWAELLNTAKTPFEALSDLVPGTEVLAPYYDSEDKINFSPALVMGRGQKKGELESALLIGIL